MRENLYQQDGNIGITSLNYYEENIAKHVFFMQTGKYRFKTNIGL